MAYNQRNNKKNNGKGCLFLIVGALLGVVASFLFLPLAGKLAATMVRSNLEGQIGYAMLTAAEPCIIAAVFFMICILTLHYFDLDSGKKVQRKPLVPDEPQPKFRGTKAFTWVITGVLILCVFASAFVYATTYRAVTTEGISTTVCQFISTKEYEWKQVSSYKVDCDEDKGLSVTLTMRDGKKFEILQSAVSAPAAFHEKYDCKEAFVLDLITMLEEEYQITRNVSHIERTKAFYQSDEKLWPYVKQIIGYDELVPEEDDAPATEAVTSAATSVGTDAETVTEGVTE